MDYDDERVNFIWELFGKIIIWAFAVFFFAIGALRLGGFI